MGEWDAGVVDRSLETLSVSTEQWVARLKPLSKPINLRRVATGMGQPMCVIYDNEGKSCVSNGTGAYARAEQAVMSF